MSEQYIEDVVYWASAFQAVASSIEQSVLEQDDKPILVYRVRFSSGHRVVALSSRPSNLRAKKGKIVIDEAAFHQDLDELLKAAIAILAWGGQVRVISTHNGTHNAFNKLIQNTYAGKFDYALHKITLDDAIADGLYKRICLINSWEYTPATEHAWRTQLVKNYGVAADEELFCIPQDIKGGGKLFKREWFRVIDALPLPYVGYDLPCVRFWDMAATSGDIKRDAFYTASVMMGRYRDKYFIVDARARQFAPAESDDWMLAIAQKDGELHQVRWELEGGSAGLRVEHHLKQLLRGFDAKGVRPQGDKVTRAKPIASEAKRGNVYLLKGAWNNTFINALYQFDGTAKPLANDYADALSGAWTCLQVGRIPAILNT